MPITDSEKEKLINDLVQCILDNQLELQNYHINTVKDTSDWLLKLEEVNEAAFSSICDIYIDLQGENLPPESVHYLLEAINKAQLIRRLATDLQNSSSFRLKKMEFPNLFKDITLLTKILKENIEHFLVVSKEIDPITVIDARKIPELSSEATLKQIAKLLIQERSKNLSIEIITNLNNYVNKMQALQTKNKLHSGNSYARSLQLEKLYVANRVQSLLANSDITDRQKLVCLQTEIRANKKWMGIPLFHDRKNNLASILRSAEQELISRLESKPYERSIAKLETYINTKKAIPGTFIDRGLSGKQNLKIGSHFEPIVIKSNQFQKLNLAEDMLLFTINKLNNGTSRTDLEKIQKELQEAIKLNAKLTGSFPLHRKGALHEAFTDLEKEIDNTLNPKKQVQNKPSPS